MLSLGNDGRVSALQPVAFWELGESRLFQRIVVENRKLVCLLGVLTEYRGWAIDGCGEQELNCTSIITYISPGGPVDRLRFI